MRVRDVSWITEILPHRPPFLLVDRILELDPGRRAVGIKAVSMSDPVLSGHFPGYPVYPGVLVVEALAQVGALLVLESQRDRNLLAMFGGIDRFRFRRPVVPGDVLRLEVELLWQRGRAGKGYGKASVEGEVAAEGELSFGLVPREARASEGVDAR
nr:3-hydroxyacyl-ACP dehydratase FabZ [Brockia lithotrophica]